MKDVPGWEVSPGDPRAWSEGVAADVGLRAQVGKSAYHTKRYTPSTVVVI